MLSRLRSGSLTELATEALLQLILDRRFPNDKLPNEPDLASQMGISRTTVRAALQSLERFGVVSRAPGKGTIVRPQVDRDCMTLHRIIGFRGMLESRYGSDVSIEQSFTISSTPSDFTVEKLNLSAESAVLVNDKRFLVAGDLAVHMVQEVPVAFVEPQLVEDLVAGRVPAPATIFDFSRSWPGREIDNTVLDLVPAVTAEGTSPQPLGLPAGTPYLRLLEVHYSEANEGVATSCEDVRDDYVRLRLVRPR